MVTGYWSLERTPPYDGSCRAVCLGPSPSPLTSHPLRVSPGFTILEMLIVLFLLTVVVVVVFPRISHTEDLSSTGRKLVGDLRTFQRLAATSQKPLKLYLDIDQGTYWMMLVEGKEERFRLIQAGKPLFRCQNRSDLRRSPSAKRNGFPDESTCPSSPMAGLSRSRCI